jgi:hypothetical protein
MISDCAWHGQGGVPEDFRSRLDLPLCQHLPNPVTPGPGFRTHTTECNLQQILYAPRVIHGMPVTLAQIMMFTGNQIRL